MKKYLSILLTALLCVMLAVAASAADVYVNDNGTGDGSAADKPLGSMTEAINKIAADGGKVIIVDTYTCAEEFHEPEHTGDIIITGGKYVFTNGSLNRWFLSGPGSTTFENMSFIYGAGSTGLIVAQYNKLIMGEGISFDTNGKAFVLGGYQLPLTEDVAFDKDSDVTIKSGNYYLVAGHSRSAGEYEFTGTAHITVEGGEFTTIYGASVNGNYSGSAVINIKGGNISKVCTAGDGNRRLNGDCTVNISGGMIGGLTMNNVMGKTTVNFSGGAVGTAEKTVADAIAAFVVDGTATLNATPNVDAKLISLFFDKVNYVDQIPTGVEIHMTIDKASYTANGVEKPLDAAPIICGEGHTMLPARAIAVELGAEVGWDAATSTASFKTDATEIFIKINSSVATVNGVEVPLTYPAFIGEGDRTYLPIRFICENLGATVDWVEATSTAIIKK